MKEKELLKYEKPRLIELGIEKGQGIDCNTGATADGNCTGGNAAYSSCYSGGYYSTDCPGGDYY